MAVEGLASKPAASSPNDAAPAATIVPIRCVLSPSNPTPFRHKRKTDYTWIALRKPVSHKAHTGETPLKGGRGYRRRQYFPVEVREEHPETRRSGTKGRPVRN